MNTLNRRTEDESEAEKILKEQIRTFNIQTIMFYKRIGFIKENHTGKIVIEVHCNEGRLTNVKIIPEFYV